MDTRTNILYKNLESIHINGFNSTRTDKVISELGITKGAFYHYFPDKNTLGYAIIDEILYPKYISTWMILEHYNGNPIDGIITCLNKSISLTTECNVAFGCPVNNLIQEMSALDEGFKVRLERIIDSQHLIIKNSIIKGQSLKQIKDSIIAEELATFILSTLQGSYALAKVKNDVNYLKSSIELLVNYLKQLKINKK